MMEDPSGKELTIALVDQAFRSRRPARIADQLRYLLERYGVPRYMEWWERIGLALGAVLGHYLPSLVVPPIVGPPAPGDAVADPARRGGRSPPLPAPSGARPASGST